MSSPQRKENNAIGSSKSQQPGDGMSCDHMVSAQPELIPQLMDKLTHDKFWSSVLYVDDMLDFHTNVII